MISLVSYYRFFSTSLGKSKSKVLGSLVATILSLMYTPMNIMTWLNCCKVFWWFYFVNYVNKVNTLFVWFRFLVYMNYFQLLFVLIILEVWLIVYLALRFLILFFILLQIFLSWQFFLANHSLVKHICQLKILITNISWWFFLVTFI